MTRGGGGDGRGREREGRTRRCPTDRRLARTIGGGAMHSFMASTAEGQGGSSDRERARLL